MRWRLKLTPQAARRWQRFKAIRRGYLSLLLLGALVVFALLGPLLVGSRALAVRYDGHWSFPVISGFHPGTDFGLRTPFEPDYRKLKERFAAEGQGNRVWLPLVPFNGTEVNDLVVPLRHTPDGWVDQQGQPFREGRAFTRHPGGDKHRVFQIVGGQLGGTYSGYDRDGVRVESARFSTGELVPDSYRERVKDAGFGPPNPSDFQQLETYVTFPSPPGVAGHLLGTDESGRDVLARLFEGFRLMIGASMIFVAFTYLLGISIGCAMGYFGSWFDILAQRFVEIWSAIPFLYMVIILSAFITPNLVTLMIIMILFSWMGLTYYMRTATYREKSRDYVAAARVMGAGSTRIIFSHILPNTLSTVVTFLPFSVAGLVGSLTALDFLGFGLPPTDPSWGDLLKQGTTNMDSPWILYSVVTSLVVVLVLITFVGEAVREAFDPKKFTYYQ